MGMSFGMIFSVILIVIFIGVAIYAISIFLNLRACAEIGIFKEDLEGEIDTAYQSGSYNEIFEESITGRVDMVCFIDWGKNKRGEYEEIFEEAERAGLEWDNYNMFYYPIGGACEGQTGYSLRFLDIENTTMQNNPECFEREDGKIKIRIIKEYFDDLVRLEKP